MIKKILALMLCLAVGLVSGCSSNSNVNESDEKESTSSSEKVEISMVTAMAYGTEGLDIAVENFKEMHPNVTFDIQHIPNDYTTVLKSRINSGQVPDIILAQTGSQVATLYDYAYDFTDDPIVDKFNEGAIELSKSSDGELLSLPWTYETMGIIYNKDLFEKAGITELPATLDELEQVCEELQTQGILPFATAFKEQWVLAHVASHFMTTQNDDPSITVEEISSNKLKFSDIDNFNNVYQLLDLMIEYGPNKPLEIDWEISENMLSNGEAAMIHMGDWCEATLKGFNADVNVGFLPVPISDDKNDAYLASSISWQLLLNKDSENLDLKKEFLEYILTSEDGQRWMTEYVGAVPAAKTDMQPSGMLATSAKELIDSGMTKPWNHILWPAGYNMKLGAFLQEYMLGTVDSETTNTNITNGWLDEVE
jgi:raffinose/stachyose/melibiose transport system substrate-binding protein